MRTAVATDIGGGTSYSMLKTLDEAYKVLQLRDQVLNPLKSFYMMTLGNARAPQGDFAFAASVAAFGQLLRGDELMMDFQICQFGHLVAFYLADTVNHRSHHGLIT